MAHIEDRRDRGRGWRVRYRDPSHRERSKTFRRRTDAERFLISVESQKLRGEWVDPHLAKTSFEEFGAQQRQSWHRLSESTAELRDGLMRNHVYPYWKGRPLGSISQLEVQSWVDQLVGKRLSASSIRQTYGCFQRIMRSAVTARLIPASPCESIQLPKNETREMHFLAPEQVTLLAAAIGPEYETMIYFAAYTGLRWGKRLD